MIDKNKKKIITHLKTNIPLLIIGESGWGKSSIVEQTAKELKIPLITANVNSWTAEDFGGIPKVNNKGYFEYLPPKWVNDYKGKKFILFIDEINQASVPVLHALYRVVNDREVAGVPLPKMLVISAGNKNKENPYLTEMPEPLLKRFSTYNWEMNNTTAVNYINNKYNVKIKEIATNPRQTEMAIQLLLAGDKESAINLAGLQVISDIEGDSVASEGKKLIKSIEIDEAKKRNGLL